MKIKILILLISCSRSILSMDLNQLPSLEIKAAYSMRQGSKPFMEDSVVMLPNWDNEKSFFAVYDGHTGKKAVQFATNYLHQNLKAATNAYQHASKQELLVKSFQDTDNQLKALQCTKDASDQSGTTATVALLENNQLHLAWVGDSRALVIRNGLLIAQTTDHKPDEPHEEQRIRSAGGAVSTTGRLIPDGFGLARALGNHAFEAKKTNVMIGIPDVLSVNVMPDDSIIIASDGLWDDLTNEKIIATIDDLQRKNYQELYKNILAQHFTQEEVTAKGDLQLRMMARCLCDEAIRAYPLQDGKGCNGIIGNRCDNISVLLIKIKKKREVSVS